MIPSGFVFQQVLYLLAFCLKYTHVHDSNGGWLRYPPIEVHFLFAYSLATTLLQAIEYAIQHKLPRVEAGAQGEHKILRGYQAATTYSAHYVLNPQLHMALADAMKREQSYIADDVEAINDRMSAFKVATGPAGATVSFDEDGGPNELNGTSSRNKAVTDKDAE